MFFKVGREEAGEACFWHGLVVLCAIVCSSIYFSASSYFSMDDALFHMARIEGIAEGMRAGIFPVWINGFILNGYGTPEGIMYPDTLLYIPALLRLAGMPVSAAYNGYWIMITGMAFLSSYYAFAAWSESYRKGALAAVLYNSSFYWSWCNGICVGACAAMAIFPLTLFGIWSVLCGRQDRWYLTVPGTCIIAQSHVLSVIFLLVAAGVMIAMHRRRLAEAGRRRALMLALGFGIVLNLWRLLPMVDFYRRILFTINDTEHYFDGVTNTLGYVTFSWQEMFLNHGMWGWPLLGMAVFCLLHGLGKWRQGRCFYGTICLCLLITLGMMRCFPWGFLESLPVLGSILPKFQFSMRFTIWGLVPLAYYLAGYIVDFLGKGQRGRWLTAAACIFLSLYALYLNFTMQVYMRDMVFDMRSEYVLIETPPREGVHSYEDYLYADISFEGLSSRQQGRDGVLTDAEVLDFSKESSRIRLAYRAESDTEARLPLFFYPGYAGVLEDGREVSVGQTDEHVLTVILPAGEHTVTVWFRGMLPYRVAGWVSLAGMAVFGGMVYVERRRRQFPA